MGTAFRDTLLLRTFGFLKVPLIFLMRPVVLELSEERTEIRLPLTRLSKNHLGSMYFGALCIGADCAGGIIALDLAKKMGVKVSLVFKDISGQFLRRPEGDVTFTCEDGPVIRAAIVRARDTGERQNCPVEIVARLSGRPTEDPVAKFVLTLSLKRSGSS